MIRIETKPDGSIETEIVGTTVEALTEAAAALARVTSVVAPLSAMAHGCSVRDAQCRILDEIREAAERRLDTLRKAMDGEEPAPAQPEPTSQPRRRRRRSGDGLPVS